MGQKEILGHKPTFSGPQRKGQGHWPAWPALQTEAWPGNRPSWGPRAPQAGTPEARAGPPGFSLLNRGPEGHGPDPQDALSRECRPSPRVPWTPDRWHPEEPWDLAASLPPVSVAEMTYLFGKFGRFAELRERAAPAQTQHRLPGPLSGARAGGLSSPAAPKRP